MAFWNDRQQYKVTGIMYCWCSWVPHLWFSLRPASFFFILQTFDTSASNDEKWLWTLQSQRYPYKLHQCQFSRDKSPFRVIGHFETNIPNECAFENCHSGKTVSAPNNPKINKSMPPAPNANSCMGLGIDLCVYWKRNTPYPRAPDVGGIRVSCPF